MTPLRGPELFESFATEFAGVVAALAEVSVGVEPASALPEGGFLVTMVADEGGEGVLYAQVDRHSAIDLARFALGAAEDGPESDVVDGLRDVCGQAIATVIERRQMDGVRVIVASVEAVSQSADASAVLKGLTAEGRSSTPCVALWGTLELGLAAPTAAASPLSPPPAAPLRSTHSAVSTDALGGPNLEAILDLELPLIVRFGRAELPLKDLAMLAPGAVIDLGRSPDDPVEVLVSNQVVALGEVVTVNGNYGVRITDVVGAADRIRHMEIAS
jgi:flagellar motor switch protein FliN/FliY